MNWTAHRISLDQGFDALLVQSLGHMPARIGRDGARGDRRPGRLARAAVSPSRGL